MKGARIELEGKGWGIHKQHSGQAELIGKPEKKKKLCYGASRTILCLGVEPRSRALSYLPIDIDGACTNHCTNRELID